MNARPSTTARGRYHGVAQVVAFNWPQYACGLVVVLLAVLLAWRVSIPAWIKPFLLAGAGCALFWMVASLLVSHHVYDRSKLHRWDWVAEQFPLPPRRMVNIHAGLDESSEALRRIFPESRIVRWDIHESETMTERSIARARRRTHRIGLPSAHAVDFTALPAVGGCFDALFLIFAAHEIRAEQARERFFGELQRVLKPGGYLLMVEHLRDWKNFFAYGPGCFHFLPRREWLRLARTAGFTIQAEFSITPYVRIFHFRKP